MRRYGPNDGRMSNTEAATCRCGVLLVASDKDGLCPLCYADRAEGASIEAALNSSKREALRTLRVLATAAAGLNRSKQLLPPLEYDANKALEAIEQAGRTLLVGLGCESWMASNELWQQQVWYVETDETVWGGEDEE